MGKGDKRSRRGKLFMGSFGNSRPHTAKKSTHAPAPTKAKAAVIAAKEVPAKKERKPAAKKAKKE